jgi:hypothetical protein
MFEDLDLKIDAVPTVAKQTYPPSFFGTCVCHTPSCSITIM